MAFTQRHALFLLPVVWHPTDETFVHLKSKHPFSDPPVIPHCPSSAPQSPLQLPPGYNMYKLLKSFKTATACGPSGMRVQHLLDAMKATLPLSLQTTLCHVVNMLLAGQAPACLAPLIVGGNNSPPQNQGLWLGRPSDCCWGGA